MSSIIERKLKTPYVSVDGSYGGNQAWLSSIDRERKGHTLMDYGCGLIGATDILLHLMGEIDGVGASPDRKSYMDVALRMERRLFHILPKLGISGILLALGMNIYFWRNRKRVRNVVGGRLHARWAVRPSRIIPCIREMLSEDIPVILAIGPAIFTRDKVTFYGRTEQDGKMIFKPVSRAKDHYVTVTGMIEDQRDDTIMFEISSWGKRYYVNYNEYKNYIRKHDNYYFSNILYIKKK